MSVSVGRSPWRLVAYAALAVPMILLAVDMLFSYRFIEHPETYEVVVGETINAEGETVDLIEDRLTATGNAERRRDIGFGMVLLVTGGVSMAWSVMGLIRPRRMLVADDTGVNLRGANRRTDALHVPWQEIIEVRSSLMDDEGADVSVLSIRFADPDRVPLDRPGAIADPPWLHLYADDWDMPAHQVAAVLDVRVHRPTEEAQ